MRITWSMRIVFFYDTTSRPITKNATEPERVNKQQSHQPYDSALKGLMGSYAVEIIPQFIPGAQIESEGNSEIERESIRAGLVYRIQYMGKPHILNMELQTGLDSEMADRMLQYHVEVLYGGTEHAIR